MTEFERAVMNRVSLLCVSLLSEIPIASMTDVQIMMSNLKYHTSKLEKLIADG